MYRPTTICLNIYRLSLQNTLWLTPVPWVFHRIGRTNHSGALDAKDGWTNTISINGTESILFFSNIFKPAAPFVFSEIPPVSNRLALESLLKEMSYSSILVINLLFVNPSQYNVIDSAIWMLSCCTCHFSIVYRWFKYLSSDPYGFPCLKNNLW